MAGRMVVAAWRGIQVNALALSPLLFAIAACSSFAPVGETRFVLLNESGYKLLGMPSEEPKWAVYDDQHSPTFSCTNGAAGGHRSAECSVVYKDPPFDPGPRCLKDKNQAESGDLRAPGPEGVCIQGMRPHMLHCVDHQVSPDRCYEDAGLDVSNMWGAGVGLSFSSDGNTPWNPEEHGVTGVAFEFSGPESVRANLRVGIPTVLKDSDVISDERPLTRFDASVVDTKGNVYDCDGKVADHYERSNKLSDVRVDGKPSILTSRQHPSGSSFWQPDPQTNWIASPVVDGQNQFDLKEVLPPPLTTPGTKGFDFDRTQMLGIHFQIVYQDRKNDELPFSFCIKNLAVILK